MRGGGLQSVVVELFNIVSPFSPLTRSQELDYEVGFKEESFIRELYVHVDLHVHVHVHAYLLKNILHAYSLIAH